MNPGLQTAFSKALTSSLILLPTKSVRLKNSRESNPTRAEHPPDIPSSPRASAGAAPRSAERAAAGGPRAGCGRRGRMGAVGLKLSSSFWGSLRRYCRESRSPALLALLSPPPIRNFAVLPPRVHLTYECLSLYVNHKYVFLYTLKIQKHNY